MTEQGDLFPPVDDDHAAFLEFLAERIAAGPATTDDVLGAVLPLMHQALAAHDTGRVAPLDGVDAIAVDFGRLWFENSRMLPPRRNLPALRRLRPRREASVEVRRDLRERIDLDRGESEFTERFVAEAATEEGTTEDCAALRALPIDRPAYLRDFVGWEHAVEHHDPLTDIYSLGMIMAALAFGLDFTRAEDVERFAAHHDNLFRLNGAIHPVVVKVIARMTLLYRGRRAQDFHCNR